MKEIFKTLNEHHIALEFDKVLLNLSKFAHSELSKNTCLNLEIFDKKAQIEYELNLVSQARKVIEDTQSDIPVDDIYDTDKIFNKSTFSPEEIIELVKNLKTSRNTKNFISKSDKPDLTSIVSNLYTDKTLEDEVSSIFDSELNIKDSASDILKSLRNSYKDNKENQKNAIAALLSDHAFLDNLQDTIVSSRDSRPVFQVKASCKNKVPGIVHDVSATNLTYFIEPASIVPLTNKLKQIEIEIKAEIDRILRELSNKFLQIKKEIEQNQKTLIEIDTIFSKARYSIHLKAQRADIISDKIIDIQGMKHPLLIDTKENVIENDFNLGINYNCLLITGANTGGKTVAMKTAGLMVLMTKAGLHIPCLGAKIFPYKDIYCDISKEQSLEQGFSTFSAHIVNISNILKSIDEKSLVILDELGSGTDPQEGCALAKAMLEYIKKKSAHAIVTTHLGELKNLKFEDPSFENATVLFDTTTLEPLYKLIIGTSGMSSAIDISMTLGLNEEVINNARNYFKQNNGSSSQMFLEMEKTSLNIQKKEQDTNTCLNEAKLLKEEYETKLKELKQNKKKSLDNFKKKFQTQLEEARAEIKSAVDDIRKEKSLKVALRSYSKLSNIENKIREDFTSQDDKLSEKYNDLKPDELKKGQSVLVKKLNQVVILESLPDKKGRVEIRIGNIKSKIPLSDLAKTDKKVAPYLKKIEVNFDNQDNLLSRLDLRGMRVIEAIDFLDEKLDKASLRGLNQISVIHGYGTGALKSAVNDYLKNSPYVAKFRYGDENEGGEGIVIVDLL